MKSPPEPELTKALAGISRFPTKRETDRIRRESEEEEPVKVIDETSTNFVWGREGESSSILGSVGEGSVKSAPGRS